MSHLFIKQVPYAGRASMRVSQESDQHDHKEHCVNRHAGGSAGQGSMRLQDNARPNNWVIRCLDLSSTRVSGHSGGETLP